MSRPVHARLFRTARTTGDGRLLAGFLLMILFGALARSHEVRPAVLRITEHTDHRIDVLWRQPSDGVLAIHLEPQISGGLLDRAPDAAEVMPDSQSRLWRNIDPGAEGLGGHRIGVAGLEHTLLETLVFVQLADGTARKEVLSAHAPTVTLQLEKPPDGVGDYLSLGIRHILSGPDHLLFVLALVLIVRNKISLLKTITAFTLAHSLTLAASALGAVHFAPTLIDALIALSIMFIAPEVYRVIAEDPGLTARRPWLIAFCFGLLHGLGFATGLSTVGLTHGELMQALVLFNGGVEIGQLSFVAVVLLTIATLRRLPVIWPRPLLLTPAYVIGGMAAFWVIESSLLLFTPA